MLRRLAPGDVLVLKSIPFAIPTVPLLRTLGSETALRTLRIVEMAEMTIFRRTATRSLSDSSEDVLNCFASC